MPPSVIPAVAEDAKFLREIVTDLEWSGEREGPGSYMGAKDGTIFRACPLCGGLPPDEESARNSFMDSAFGHRSGCRIAKALNRPTVIAEGETGELTL